MESRGYKAKFAEVAVRNGRKHGQVCRINFAALWKLSFLSHSKDTLNVGAREDKEER